MKKNLMTVLILALLIVNLVLTSVMMFSVMGTNKKTAELVGNIATVLNLELWGPGTTGPVTEVALENSVPYDIADPMTILLKSDDGSDHYVKFKISFYMNSKADGYKSYGATIAEQESLIKGTITSVVSSHTESECKEDFESIKDEILKAIQDLFKSDFIYKVAISEIQFGR